MNRIVWIDIAKAVCIILVVIGHYYPDIHPAWYEDMRNVIYSFHMPLFIFVSGFVYNATKKDITYGDFVWKKVKRLMVPYLTVSVLVITLKLFTQGQAYMENPVTALSYVKMFYRPEAGYFLWFIWALWWMFVCIPFFKTPNSRLSLLIFSVFLPMVSPYLPDEFCLKEFSRMLQFFVAGVVAYDWRQYLLWAKHIPVFVVALFFCLIEVLQYVWGNCSFIAAYVGIAFVLKLSCCIEEKVKANNTWGKFVMLLSAASYIIYLLHTTFEGFVKAIVFKLPYLSDLSNDIMFTIGAIMVIFTGVMIPVLLYKYVLRRYLVTKVLFGLK